MLKSYSGRDGRLTVTVKQYSPSVQCTPSDRPAVGAMCDYIVQDMPASKAQIIFGNRGSADIDIPIPWTMATREFPQLIESSPRCKTADYFITAGLQCVVKARMTAGLTAGPTVQTSWYDIWQQAVALTVLCAHAGKDGQAYIYGKQDLSYPEI